MRLYWLKARQHQLLGETLDAVDCFEIVKEMLQELEKENDKSSSVEGKEIILPFLDSILALNLICHVLNIFFLLCKNYKVFITYFKVKINYFKIMFTN